jgi:hypothetical protein
MIWLLEWYSFNVSHDMIGIYSETACAAALLHPVCQVCYCQGMNPLKGRDGAHQAENGLSTQLCKPMHHEQSCVGA